MIVVVVVVAAITYTYTGGTLTGWTSFKSTELLPYNIINEAQLI